MAQRTIGAAGQAGKGERQICERAVAAEEGVEHRVGEELQCQRQASAVAPAGALAGFEATVLEMSWYGDQPVAVPLA